MDASAEFRERLLGALRGASEGTDEAREVLLREMAYGAAHLAEFDQRTQLLIEQVGSLLMQQITEGVKAMSDSPEQRVLRRTLNLASGRHYRPQNLLDSLERPPAQHPGFAVQGEAVCIATLQEVADLAHDANKVTTSGNDGLAFQGLVTECMQE